MSLLGCESSGRLELSVIDPSSGLAIPARIELLDADQQAHVPAGAVRLSLECAFPPFPGLLQEITAHRHSPVNPATGTEQFYVAGPVTVALPPGAYRLRG